MSHCGFVLGVSRRSDVSKHLVEAVCSSTKQTSKNLQHKHSSYPSAVTFLLPIDVARKRTIFEISRKNCGWRSHLLIIYFILPNKTQEYNKGEAIIPQRRTVPSHPSTHRATVAPRTALLVALHRHRISASFSASRHATLCSQKAKPRTQFLSFHFYSGSRATSARRTARASLEGNTYTPAHALRLAPPSPPP